MDGVTREHQMDKSEQEYLREAYNWMAMTYGYVQNSINGLLFFMDCLEERFPGMLQRPDYLPPKSTHALTMTGNGSSASGSGDLESRQTNKQREAVSWNDK